MNNTVYMRNQRWFVRIICSVCGVTVLFNTEVGQNLKKESFNFLNLRQEFLSNYWIKKNEFFIFYIG